MRITHAFDIPLPPDQVARVLCSEPYNVEVEAGREGVAKTEFCLLSSDDSGCRFEMRSVEYQRTPTGGLNRKVTGTSQLRHVYEAGPRVLRWDYAQQGSGPKLDLRGTYRIEPTKAGCHVVHDVDIEVRIPLIGKAISRLVARQFEADLPRYQKALQKHLST